MNNNLDTLGNKYQTDKASNWHNYCNIYEQYLHNKQDSIKNVLEIGICYGGSLRMWRDFFKNANILGVDIDKKWIFQEDRIECIEGDATNIEWLKNNLFKREKFDLIIDDGSHNSFDINNTFLYCFENLLKDSGIYIIEDLHATYENIHNKIEFKSTTEFFKSMIDELNWGGGMYGDWKKSGEPKNYWQRYIDFIHFYKSLIIIGKR